MLAERGRLDRRSVLLECASTAALLVAVLALSSHLPRPGLAPPPGSSMLHRVGTGGHERAVVVAPQRPGWNLVLLPGEGGAAGTDRHDLVPATRRPGAPDSWALVHLPPGATRLWVRQDGQLTGLDLSTSPPEGRADLRGPDGPECVAALVGRLLAGASTAVPCPADELRATDAAVLSHTVEFIARRGVRAVAVVADSSPRSLAAARSVRAAAAINGLAVVRDPGRAAALVVVSGWAAAQATLTRVAAGDELAAGVYLAPWLLSPPLVETPAGQVIALPFQPDGALSRRYLSTLDSGGPGIAPTGSGLTGWLSGLAEAAGAGAVDRAAPPVTRLYAPARINLDPAAVIAAPPTGAGAGDRTRDRPGAGHGHLGAGAAWLPGGRLTAVSGPLDAGR